MAFISQAFIGSFFFLLIVSLSLQIVAGRNVPADPNVQAEVAGDDGTVLIPGLGRFMVPKKGQKPLHYNPITGAPGGTGFPTGFPIPEVGGSTGSGSYLPAAKVPSPFSGSVPQH